MTRTTRDLSLVLIGSAILLVLFFSCSGCNDDEQHRNYAGTGHRSYYRSRPWFFGWGGGGYGGSSYRSSSPSHSTTTHTGSSTATSRGGFGGHGSAHSSGS